MRKVANALILRATVLLCVIASQSAAETQTCRLQNQTCFAECAEISVQFEIDRAQFAAPVDPNDPPRRQVAKVVLEGQPFTATAILFPDGTTGFHEDAGELDSRLMVVQPDGTARLASRPSNQTWIGTCTRP